MDENHTDLPSSYIVKFLVFWTLLKTCINSAIKFKIAVANKGSLVVLPLLNLLGQRACLQFGQSPCISQPIM